MGARDWYNAERVATPGSVVLSRALPTLRAANEARRQASRSPAPRNDMSGLTPSAFSDWLATVRNGSAPLNERTAMSVDAVYACVALIGGAVASLPVDFFRNIPATKPGGRDVRERYKPDLWWMLNEEPAPAWNAAVFWEYLLTSLLLRGDAFARILRPSPMSQKVIGFEPLHPSTVDVRRVDKELVYDVTAQPWEPGSTGKRTLFQDDVLHVPGPGFDGLRGLSQLSYTLRLSASSAIAADEFGAAFFRNGARPDFALQTEGNLDADQVKALRDQLDENHRGADRAFRPMVLGGGLKVEPITMNAKDSQLIESRGFTVEQIARIFGVPPFMIGHAEKTTSWGSGVEQMGIGFVKYTLQRHLVKFEQEINRKLFRTSRNFCEFNTAGLERGDFKSRNEGYRIGLGRAGEPAWLLVNEVRAMENLPPLPGGDDLPKPAAPAPEPKPADPDPNEPNEGAEPGDGEGQQ